MIASLVRKVVGSRNARELKRMGRIVARINALEESMQALTDEQLAAKTPEFRERLQSETLDDLLPEAFAAAREASRRTRGERPYDVQLIGGITLHEGKIAEMRTGEGKTLVATLPAYLNALGGGAVHIVTVNDYLARRDAAWMGPIYDALGMTVGVLQSQQDRDSKHAAYRADITYGTNSEFGFDYLRDNMVFTRDDRSQRALDYAIVDEVDSILIDEARTPLIISGPATESNTNLYDLYRKINRLAPKLKQQDKIERNLPAILQGDEAEPEETGDFFIDEKNRQVELTERGHELVENELKRLGLLDENDSLFAAANLELLHHVNTALKAHFLFPARCPLHGAGRRGGDRRRAHRPCAAGADLAGRRPPGHRGQGRAAGPARDADGCVDDPAELLPPVRQTRRDDGHGRHRGHGVQADLRSRGHRHSHPHADDPRRPQRSRLPHHR